MQSLKAKKNYQIETYLIEGDHVNDENIFKRLDSKHDYPLNLLPNPKPPFAFTEKAHSLDEYIEIGDSLFQKNLQSTIDSHSTHKYEQYTIQKHDTLYGIAFKFDISVEIIKNLNFLTEDSNLFPGQIISIPMTESTQINNEKKENSDVFNLEEIAEWLKNEENSDEENKEEIGLEEMLLKKKNSRNSNNNEKLSFNRSIKNGSEELENYKFEAYYCTSYGDIKGILTINEYLLMFDPLGTSQTDKKNSRSLDFQVCLDLHDISEAFIMSLPNKYCDEQFHDDLKVRDFNKDCFLELNVNRIGDEAIEKKYEDRIKIMTIEKLPLATVFFKIYDKYFNEEIKNSQKYAIASEIQKKLTEMMKKVDKKVSPTTATLEQVEISDKPEKTFKSSTKIPFFDILYENLFKASKKKNNKGYKSKPIIKNLTLFGVLPEDPKDLVSDIEDVPEYIPKLIEDSNILTNEYFLQILDYIPPSLKLRNWKLIYSNAVHGTSLNTLFFKCEDIGPSILVVQDFKNWIFGAFCSCSWERGQQFYGKGETFLFSFKNGKRMNSFTWTGKNYDFQFADSDGLALGAGDKYGLYIKGDLLGGNSHCCQTFDNDVLSEENNFDIRFIEIWGCDEFIDI